MGSFRILYDIMEILWCFASQNGSILIKLGKK